MYIFFWYIYIYILNYINSFHRNHFAQIWERWKIDEHCMSITCLCMLVAKKRWRKDSSRDRYFRKRRPTKRSRAWPLPAQEGGTQRPNNPTLNPHNNMHDAHNNASHGKNTLRSTVLSMALRLRDEFFWVRNVDTRCLCFFSLYHWNLFFPKQCV